MIPLSLYAVCQNKECKRYYPVLLVSEPTGPLTPSPNSNRLIKILNSFAQKVFPINFVITGFTTEPFTYNGPLSDKASWEALHRHLTQMSARSTNPRDIYVGLVDISGRHQGG